ncbi:hypothetical protein HDU98_003784, partial [Podochytrium sp. JEL0797]
MATARVVVVVAGGLGTGKLVAVDPVEDANGFKVTLVSVVNEAEGFKDAGELEVFGEVDPTAEAAAVVAELANEDLFDDAVVVSEAGAAVAEAAFDWVLLATVDAVVAALMFDEA